MPKNSEEKSFLSLAGEYAVCSELQKREIHCSLTYGNQKATDVIAFDRKGKEYRRIEVKTSRSKRFVTGFFQKYYDSASCHPDYWIIVFIDENDVSHFYVMTHNEMGNVQMERNKMTEWQEVKGCDNVELRHIEKYENQWEKIIKFQ